MNNRTRIPIKWDFFTVVGAVVVGLLVLAFAWILLPFAVIALLVVMVRSGGNPRA